MKITRVEEKTTSTGKTYKKCEIDGKWASMWSDNPEYSKAVEGAEISGTLVQKGDYWNIVADKPVYKGGGGAGIKVAQERKEQSIAKAQDNKDWNIMTASTFTQAWNIALREIEGLPFPIDDDLLKSFNRWRLKLVNEWDIKPEDKHPF